MCVHGRRALSTYLIKRSSPHKVGQRSSAQRGELPALNRLEPELLLGLTQDSLSPMGQG